MSLHGISGGLFQPGLATIIAGVISGFFIGIVAALLGVVGGELLIPTIVILFGVDIKQAGSLSLMISLPTMIVGFSRYINADAFQILRKEKSLFVWMVAGSVIGAAMGGLMLGLFPVKALMTLLGVILLISAIKTFKHTRKNQLPVRDQSEKNALKSEFILVSPRIYINDNIPLGPGKIDLLRAIDGFHSLSAAAKDLGIPYKRAWFLIDTLNKVIGKPVVITSTGGSKGGGTVLTPFGQELLGWYDKAEANFNEQSQQDLQALEKIIFGAG
ncbi:TSUP family transporter [Salmonella enterica subsp. enterica serovar Newport]|uniref:TSUP family transporter n=2 Tax=Salmonella enterica TaxID=28901 RepID=UPI0003BD1F7C|nr:TSUP family transporter [Salmonella enterica]ECJ2318331.1 TSUP family transporter [Salmonella enterica subsp. diarizonae]ECM3182539.1 TSUP family transporter [Salmonella enterica subsp. enterica serovar Newport]ESJ27700.1 hypothetical protein CFSAN001091_19265 [Salmonella enterica subsp. enterica serovar Nchanga str. CFSAN001091]ESJ34587.1 hypothetical protein CFSAN001092_07555 [Salmonella enterica subsp. enterica serovar Nchanga str. CFSAN001092]MCS1376163.1 LysR family transcriptional reg